MTLPSTILLIDDDPNIIEMVQTHLERYDDYKVVTLTDFTRVLDTFKHIQPALVLLEKTLPDFDDLYWCRQIRTVSKCPILIISASTNPSDQVLAIEIGADDYLAKPFSNEVLAAKVRSLLRRAYGDYASHAEERLVTYAGLTLYAERFLVSLASQTAQISKQEAHLLECFLQHCERVVSRQHLLEVLGDENSFLEENTLNVYITRLRKKLQELGITNALQTVWGEGYRLTNTWDNLLVTRAQRQVEKKRKITCAAC